MFSMIYIEGFEYIVFGLMLTLIIFIGYVHRQDARLSTTEKRKSDH